MNICELYPNKKLNNHQITIITDYDKDIINDGVFVSFNNKYIDSAINNGAKTIIYKGKITKQPNINYIKVESPKKELARILKKEFEYKNSQFPCLIGVTGTNGKTTSTYLLYQYFKWMKYDVLLIGTGWIYSFVNLQEKHESINNTTPSISYLYKYLRLYNYDFVVMEVSSHGIEEGRILGLEFDIISLTNLTHDHLDYHQNMLTYKIVKGKLLSFLNPNSKYKTIILNKDDQYYSYFNNLCLDNIVTYGMDNADISIYSYDSNIDGIQLKIKDNKLVILNTHLIGDFNVYNLLNLYVINKVLQININFLKSFLSNIEPVPGRMNLIKKDRNTFIVDYAHTPDGVFQVLTFVKRQNLRKNIVVIIGSGGSRDKEKRKQIGNIVTKYADYVYFTEDNSREEATPEIILDMISGVYSNNYEIILSRKTAITEANEKHIDSLILVLGKGIENEIIRCNEIIQHNDVEYIRDL